MATHEVTFPVADEREILKLRAGDEVVVQGHIIGIRDRTQIRIFHQGVEPPMDLRGAFLLHTAPNVRKVEAGVADGTGVAERQASPGAPAEQAEREPLRSNAASGALYEKICIGTKPHARMVRLTEPLG